MKRPDIRPEVLDFHRREGVIDLHLDILLTARLFRFLRYDISKQHRPLFHPQPLVLHADIPRMLEGGYRAAILGLHYWPWESPKGWAEASKQLSILEKKVEEDPRITLAKTPADLEKAHREGKIALLTGIEGAHILNGSLTPLDEAGERGCVYLTLAHFSKNSAATPGLGRGKNQTDGLTEWGKNLVRKLNQLKMFVDVAHVNNLGVLDACSVSSQPVIASHSCAQGVHPSPRGLTDDGIKAIAETGGVIGLIFAPQFIRGKLLTATDTLIEHAKYIADLVGPQHLAIGTDFDGWIFTIPSDLRDCRDLPLFTQKLLDAGFSKEETAGILGKNFSRVFRQLRGEQPPTENQPATQKPKNNN